MIDEPPPDKGYVAYWSMYMLGAGVLCPWNAFITAADYFGAIYPGHMDRKFSVSYLPSMLVTLIAMLFLEKRMLPRTRISITFAGFVIILLLIPLEDLFLVTGSHAPPMAEVITIAGLVVTGVLDGIGQGTVLGEASYLPSLYQQGLSSGSAAAGVLISFLRIFTKAIVPNSIRGLRVSTAIYFISSALICGMCLSLHMFVLPNLPIIKYYKNLAASTNKDGKQEDEENEKVDLIPKGHTSNGTVVNVMRKLVYPLISLFLIYVVTLTIFPGVPAEDVHSKVLKDWYPILLITVFNVFDLIGRTIPSRIPVTDNGVLLLILTSLRLLFFPLFLLTLKLFPEPIIFFILTGSLGFSNGYLTVNAFVMSAKRLTGEENYIGGTIQVLSLVVGLNVGAVGGWGLLALE